MATAALTTRDKALIGMLYDSGCRIGEILGLRMKSVERYQHGFRVTVAGMKGSRRLPLIACAPYLAAWLNEHPRRDDPQASLWVTKDYRAQVPSYNRVCDILRSAARRAGVRKAVNPHNFRHSRATHLAKLLTEAQMKEYFGWVQGSDMASTYVHLSGRDLDHVMLKVNNIHAKEDEKASDDFYPKLCRHCGRQNPPGNKFCGQCSNVLDEKAEQEMVQKGLDRGTADGIMDRMLDVEWFRAAFERRLGDVLRERAASLPAPSPSAHRQEARPVSTAA
jgi:ribosomal protein L40E